MEISHFFITRSVAYSQQVFSFTELSFEGTIEVIPRFIEKSIKLPGAEHYTFLLSKIPVKHK